MRYIYELNYNTFSNNNNITNYSNNANIKIKKEQ